MKPSERDKDEIKRLQTQVNKDKQYFPSTEQLSMYTEQIEAVVAAIKNAKALIEESLKNYQPKITQDELKQFESRWGLILKDLNSRASTLGENGWTISLEMDIPDIQQLLGKDEVEITSFYKKLYTKENVGQLFARILQDQRFPKWNELVLQIQRAYNRKDWQVCVPAAVSLFEGILAELLALNSPWVKQPITDQLETLKSNDIYYVIGLSLKGFVDAFYKNIPFYGNQNYSGRSTIINRHWIMHGRDDPGLWGQLDVLRILNATVSAIVIIQ